MRPQQIGRPGSTQPRVIPLVPRTVSAAREAIRATARDWVAWICLVLGILCGAGAVYYALLAMTES